jgi:hypothetical protein
MTIRLSGYGATALPDAPSGSGTFMDPVPVQVASEDEMMTLLFEDQSIDWTSGEVVSSPSFGTAREAAAYAQNQIQAYLRQGYQAVRAFVLPSEPGSPLWTANIYAIRSRISGPAPVAVKRPWWHYALGIAPLAVLAGVVGYDIYKEKKGM